MNEAEQSKDGNKSGLAGATLPTEIRGELGRQLRQVYGEMLAEPLPDKFSQLLNDLAKSEKR